MYIRNFVRVKRCIATTINIVLITFPFYFSEPSLANSEDNISHLLRSKERTIQELYQLNSRKIAIMLASGSCQNFQLLGGRAYEKDSGFFSDLHRETFDLGLELYESPEEKTIFLKEQLKTALLIESLHQDLHSYDCVSRLAVVLSQDFILKIQMMLAEEESKI